MKPFEYKRPADTYEAVAVLTEHSDAVFLAGGSNLVDHLKLGITEPGLVVDIGRLDLTEVEALDDGGLRIGAMVRNSEAANDPRVRRDYPMLSRALLSGASGQLRNAATMGGNLLQRTRCVYFQDKTTPCNKRDPGSGCSAIDGYTRYHAILGASPTCVATHPSDMAVALTALDATIIVLGHRGERRIPISDLYRLPGEHPERDTVLERDDLITALELPPPHAGRSTYRKLRDRASYAFALVSVAAEIDVDASGPVPVIREAAIALGGVAHAPWRAHRAEAVLRGAEATRETFQRAADAELEAAEPLEGNAFKIPMARGAITTVLAELTDASAAEPDTEESHE
ncbi:FAD binding domain-containing protein [Brevibacterium marinum]|uniref:Xanthine dehydrogenase YagS FAD-binding subunit n=1 Tax=Brevibacterium marinum TaxID=418643 RepID=A0A846RZZ1_9MICO|nr:xanthine dehydrogenase family protein subunit M [Brevibacterium marinum]NJC56408.1 xanthine dehydrogenase YagS FAD-binding subunit [Brevibacterium marinum]